MNLDHLPDWRSPEPKYIDGIATPERLAEVLEASINQMEFTTRTANCIMRVKFRETWKLCVMRDSDLLRIDGLGKRSLADIRQKCYCLPGYSPQFEERLAEEFWLWAARTGFKDHSTVEERMLFVALLVAWPELRSAVEKIQAE